MRCPIKIPFLQYSELSIDGTEQISGKIRAGQNFPETNLLLENGNLSKIFKCMVHLICWDFLRRESPETGLKGNSEQPSRFMRPVLNSWGKVIKTKSLTLCFEDGNMIEMLSIITLCFIFYPRFPVVCLLAVVSWTLSSLPK